MNSDGKVYDGATCEIPDYKALMDGVTSGAIKETPWIDEKSWENGRVLETFISSDNVDVQGDSILQRGLAKVMPWLNKYGYYEWHHTGFPVGHYLGWRLKDGKVQVRVGFHDTAHSNMPAHDKAWQIVREFGDKGRSSIKGAPNAIKKLMSGVRVIDDLGCFAVGWVGDNAANPFAEVTSVSFAKGAALAKKVEQQGDRWAVVSEGAADPIATFATKEEADATLNAIEGNKATDALGKEYRRLKYFPTESEARAFADTVSTVHSSKGEVEEDKLKGQWYVVYDEKSAQKARTPDSLHDKIAKELFGKALGDCDDIQKAQVTRRAEELLMLQAEELFKERAAGRLSLAIYGELLLFKERAALQKAVPCGNCGKPTSNRTAGGEQPWCDECDRKLVHNIAENARMHGRNPKDEIESLFERSGGKVMNEKLVEDEKKPEEKKSEAEKAEKGLSVEDPLRFTCPECNGQGERDGQPCKNCGGSGKIKQQGAKSGVEKGEECPKCAAIEAHRKAVIAGDMDERDRQVKAMYAAEHTCGITTIGPGKSARLRIKSWLAKEARKDMSARELIKEWLVKADDLSNGTGCPYCGMAYSFFFNTQYHKKGCPALEGKRVEGPGGEEVKSGVQKGLKDVEVWTDAEGVNTYYREPGFKPTDPGWKRVGVASAKEEDSSARLPQGPSSTAKEAKTTMNEIKKDVPAPPAGGAQAGNIESRVDALDKAMTEIKGMLAQLVAEEGATKADPTPEQPKQPKIEDIAAKAASLQKQLDETRNESAKLQKELALKKQGTGSAQVDNTAPEGNTLVKAFEGVKDGTITGTEFRKTVEKATGQ